MAGARKPAGGRPVVMVAVEPIKFDRKRFEPGGELTVPSDLADELEQQGAAVQQRRRPKLNRPLMRPKAPCWPRRRPDAQHRHACR